MGEKELWIEFNKWEGFREVYIVRNRNRSGRRYKFVRFKGVDNAKKLKRQLGNLVLEGLKLYVNLPKHEREQNPIETINKKHQPKEEATIAKVKKRDKDKGNELAEQC